MEILKRLLPLLTLLMLPAFAADWPYRVIAYHDVRDQVAAAGLDESHVLLLVLVRQRLACTA